MGSTVSRENDEVKDGSLDYSSGVPKNLAVVRGSDGTLFHHSTDSHLSSPHERHIAYHDSQEMHEAHGKLGFVEKHDKVKVEHNFIVRASHKSKLPGKFVYFVDPQRNFGELDSEYSFVSDSTTSSEAYERNLTKDP